LNFAISVNALSKSPIPTAGTVPPEAAAEDDGAVDASVDGAVDGSVDGAVDGAVDAVLLQAATRITSVASATDVVRAFIEALLEHAAGPDRTA
jgi:hypothetical protein